MFIYKLLQILLFLPFKLLFPTRIIGKKNLVKGGGILIANHQSYLDIPMLGLNICRYQVFMAKKELFEKFFFKSLLKSVGAISVNREKVELSTIKKSLMVLKKEKYLTIFPQGTRTSGEMQNLKNGAVLFSIKSTKPIIPIYIIKKPRIFTFNKIIIGKPIYCQDFDTQNKQELERNIENEILSFYSTVKQQVRSKNVRRKQK